MIDIFSRYVVGWMLAETETAELATEFIDDVIRVYGKPKVMHADRGDIDDARAFCKEFFDYYNHEHYHSGLGLHTPASVHFATAEKIRADRAEVLAAAYARNPERFSRRPEPPKLPTVARINPPSNSTQLQNN